MCGLLSLFFVVGLCLCAVCVMRVVDLCCCYCFSVCAVVLFVLFVDLSDLC